MLATKYEEWEVVSAYSIMKWLSENGFDDINCLSLFENGSPYYKVNGVGYIKPVILNWEQVELKNTAVLSEAARLLARFHKSAAGFEKPTGIQIKTEWGRHVGKYKLMLTKARKLLQSNFIKEEESLYPLELEIVKKAEASEVYFKSDSYLQLLETSMRNKELGFATLTASSFMYVEGRLRLSSGLELAYNMALEDVAKLVRSCCEIQLNSQNKISARELILEEYTRVVPLGKLELQFLDAFAFFPYVSLKYMLRNHQEPCVERREQLQQKFIRSCERQTAK